MQTQRLDTLLAYKALSLVPGLTVADRRVAAAIIDHFNHEDGRCDPSVERLVDLLGLNRTTVLRSIRALDRLGLIRKVRHGGYSLRNSYEPVWTRFREIEEVWKTRFNANSANAGVARLPRRKWRGRNVVGGASATQTYPINLSKEPVRTRADARPAAGRRDDEVVNGQARQGTRDHPASSLRTPARMGTRVHRHDRHRPKPLYAAGRMNCISGSRRYQNSTASSSRRSIRTCSKVQPKQRCSGAAAGSPTSSTPCQTASRPHNGTNRWATMLEHAITRARGRGPTRGRRGGVLRRPRGRDRRHSQREIFFAAANLADARVRIAQGNQRCRPQSGAKRAIYFRIPRS